MYTKVKIFGHAVHPMLVAFPVTLYTATFVSYIVYESTHNLFWYNVAFVSNVAGIIMALVAAVPGFIDWGMGIPNGTQAKKVGLRHMLLNVGALLVFTINAIVQWTKSDELMPGATLAIILTAIGMALTMAAGFHGWHLIQHNHVGVDLTPEQERLEPHA